MSTARFAQSPAGRVVQSLHDGRPYWAFVPHPLPPALEFDSVLLMQLSDADRALGELAGLGRTMLNPQLLISPFLRQEAVLSSRIEGTQTGIVELYAYEAGQLALPGIFPSPVEDVQEVLNYVDTLYYGQRRIKELPVSLRLIRELHERLMQGVRGQNKLPGEFRRDQNWIGRAGAQISEAEYVPPPMAEMLEALNTFERYIHADASYPPLVRIALLHYQFEAIHPFLDGNGRIGRLLITLLLLDWDLLPLPLLYLSAFFERNRREYYDLLLAVSERGVWNEWLLFFLRGVAEQAREAVKLAKQLQDLQYRWRDQLLQAKVPASVSKLADCLFNTPIITIPQAQRVLEMSYNSAHRAIDRLIAEHILEPMNYTSSTRGFVAHAILDIITRVS